MLTLSLATLVACSVAEDAARNDDISEAHFAQDCNAQNPDNCEPDCDDPCGCDSPIVIDTAGDGYDLTPLEEGVVWNLTGNGSRRYSWTVPEDDDSWLVLDRNSNGTIDDGTELFGNWTAQPDSGMRNGYEALKVFDSNNDGRIGSLDPIFASLRLWNDANHDGVTDSGELTTLDSHGILALDLDYRNTWWRVDEYGNRFRFAARIYSRSWSTVAFRSFDVYLLSGALESSDLQASNPDYAELALERDKNAINDGHEAAQFCPVFTRGCRVDCYLRPIYTTPYPPFYTEEHANRCRDRNFTNLSQHSLDGIWPSVLRNYVFTTLSIARYPWDEMVEDNAAVCEAYRASLAPFCRPTNSAGFGSPSFPEELAPVFNACEQGFSSSAIYVLLRQERDAQSGQGN